MHLLHSRWSKRRFRTHSHDSKDAAVPGKCKVWGLVSAHAPNNAGAEWNDNGWFISTCSRLHSRWARKWRLPLCPLCSGSRSPGSRGQGELTPGERGSCPLSWQRRECHTRFLHEHTPLINKGCKLFVPFPRSSLPRQRVAVTVNLKEFLLGSLLSVSPSSQTKPSCAVEQITENFYDRVLKIF